MSTPAVRVLVRAGIEHEATAYDLPAEHDAYGDVVVEALGLDPAVTGKTLIARLDDGRLVAAVVPVSAMLDLKALARLTGVRKAAMAERDDAERATGMKVGGIAPIGHRRPLAVFVDASLADRSAVHVSGGRRGLELTLSGADLVRVTDAAVGDLAT